MIGTSCAVTIGHCHVTLKIVVVEISLQFLGIDSIHMPHIHSNISITAKLGIINNQFYRFLRLCSCNLFLDSEMVSIFVILKNES